MPENKQEKSKMPILFTKDGSPPSPIPVETIKQTYLVIS